MSYILRDYDKVLERLLREGQQKPTRTGIDTLSLFGIQCRYRIDEYFPIPTKRKYYPKSILSELIWMLTGSTNINDLEKLNSKIWSPWRSKEFETKNGPFKNNSPVKIFDIIYR